jgi:hypothetical protein
MVAPLMVFLRDQSSGSATAKDLATTNISIGVNTSTNIILRSIIKYNCQISLPPPRDIVVVVVVVVND